MVRFTAYIIDNKDEADDDISLELARLKDYASSRTEAWRNFLALVGGDRPKWNRLGYVSRKVVITIEFETS